MVAKTVFLGLAMLGISCASTSAAPTFSDTAKAVRARMNYQIHWNNGTREDVAVKNRVLALLKKPLRVEEAVQIGLLNNPGLQATYEELGIAQADLVQAGLLRNPVLSGSIHFPLSQGAQTDLTAGVVGDFLGVFMIPAKKKIAGARLEAVKAKVGDEVVELAHKVRAAYYTLVGAQQVATMGHAVAEAGEAAYEVAKGLYDAGNMSDLELAQQASLFEQVDIDALRADGHVTTDRETLTRLMGLWGADTQWQAEAKLPELPAQELAPTHVESIAIAKRLDLAAAHQEALSLAYAVGFAKDFRWLPGADIGLVYERTFAGPTVMGPGASVELPIFDQKQASIARVRAFFRQSLARERELAINIRSEVRSSMARVQYARKVVERYAQRLVPVRERVVALSQEQYNGMLLGVFQLIAAKQNEVSTYREFIEALRDYWIARADLDRAAGGQAVLENAAAAKSNQSPNKPKTQANVKAPQTPQKPAGETHEHHKHHGHSPEPMLPPLTRPTRDPQMKDAHTP